jgi:predicted DNA-binding protein YlxM (UPF0122 family)
MLYLQKKIISDYFQVFGKESLKKISKKTNINVTRIFRLVNGAEMKLSEYEKFHSLVQKNSQENRSEKFINDVRLESGSSSLNQMIEDLEYKKHLSRLIHGGK